MFPLKNGEPAPEIALRDTQGREWRLSQLRGKMVILLFGRGEYCPTGKAEFGRWNSYARQFPKLNCEAVFLVNGGREEHARFGEALRLQLPILIDEGGAVGETYGVYGVNSDEAGYPGYKAPSIYLIDAEGKVACCWRLTGPRGLPSPECLLSILAYAEHNNWKY
jgi:thioredoxin-dependent peroxiredoxin